MPKIRHIKGKKMNTIFRKKLYEWVYNTIKKDPKKFGGDDSNPLIMQEYTIQNYQNESATNLNKGYFSLLSTISRIKNKLLKANPRFDYRKRNKPKSKKNSA